MESNQDSAALTQQIQVLVATVEELTRQNQEMKLRLQQEENRSKGNTEDEGDSQRRSDRLRPISPDDQNLRDKEGDGRVEERHQREDRTECG